MKPQIILGIDPGPVRTAWVLIHGSGEAVRLLDCDWQENIDAKRNAFRALSLHADQGREAVFCEDIQSYGLAVGETVFMTARWVGRLWEYYESFNIPFTRITEPKVKLHLCGQMRAKDANVRRACLDRFEASGGGSTPEIGTKGDPGPLFMFKEVSAKRKQECGKSAMEHLWSALAVALFGKETLEGVK